MKKILIVLAVLMLTPFAVNADTVTFDNISSYNDLTVPLYNKNLNTLYNKINTNITSENIANGTIQSDDLATAISPLVRDAENIGEYVYENLDLPTTGAVGVATIAAGVAYVEKDSDSTLHRVETATSSALSSITGYENNKDNWVYLDYTGNFSIKTVATGGDQPDDAANAIVLGYCTVSAGSVTAASESVRQTTPPSLRIYQDAVIGCLVSGDASSAKKIMVGPGTIDFGLGVALRRNTTNVTIDVSVSGNMDTEAAAAASTMHYLWAYPDTSNTTNFAIFGDDDATAATNVDNERLIGWWYNDASSNVSPDSIGAYKRYSTAPNICSRSAATNITNTSTAYVQMPDMVIQFYSSGRPVRATFSAPLERDDGGSNGTAVTISIDTNTVATGHSYQSAQDEAEQFCLTGVIDLYEGAHTAQVKWATLGAGTAAQEGLGKGHRVFTIEEL